MIDVHRRLIFQSVLSVLSTRVTLDERICFLLNWSRFLKEALSTGIKQKVSQAVDPVKVTCCFNSEGHKFTVINLAHRLHATSSTVEITTLSYPPPLKSQIDSCYDVMSCDEMCFVEVRPTPCLISFFNKHTMKYQTC